jgi:hypothetical protein
LVPNWGIRIGPMQHWQPLQLSYVFVFLEGQWWWHILYTGHHYTAETLQSLFVILDLLCVLMGTKIYRNDLSLLDNVL